MCTDPRIEKTEGLFYDWRIILAAVLQGVLFLSLAYFTCGCTYLRIPISGNEHITYLRILEKRTLTITDPETGIVILLSTTDGGTEAAGTAAGAAIKALVAQPGEGKEGK